MEIKTDGQITFEAYSEAVGGKTYDRKPIPGWEDVTDKVRNGWEAAAKVVKKGVESRILDAFGYIFNKEE